MKDAVLTVRLPMATRKRIEQLARQQRRSLSAQVELLIEQSLQQGPSRAGSRRTARSLEGALRGGRVPTLEDFAEVRAALSSSFDRRTRQRDDRSR